MNLREALLDKGMKGWIFVQAKREFWRVAAWYELDDLIQDGYLCFAKCWNAYGAKLEADTEQTLEDKRKWMMALVQTAFIRHIHDLATDKTNTPEIAESQLAVSEITGAQSRFTYVAEMELNFKLQSAPAEIKAVVQALSADGSVAFNYVRTRIRRELINGKTRVVRTRRIKCIRETTNEFLCRLAGMKPANTNMRAALQEHFLG